MHTPSMAATKVLRTICVAAVGVLAAAACGASDAGNSASAPIEQVDVAVGDSSTITEDSTVEAAQADTTPLVGGVPYENELFGGVRFTVPDGFEVVYFSDEQFLEVQRTSVIDTDSAQAVRVMHLSQAPNGQAITTIADVVQALEVVGGAEVAMGDESITTVGSNFALYTVRGGNDTPVFSGHAPGFDGETRLAASGLSDLWLAEQADGVAVLWAQGHDQASLDASKDVLNMMLSTLELTTADGAIAALPVPDEAIEVDLGPPINLGDAVPFETDSVILTTPQEDLGGGQYQVLEFGFPIEMTLPAGSAVTKLGSDLAVIASTTSRRPYDGDLRMTIGTSGLVPLGAGRLPIGQPLSLADLESILDSPPSNLQFSNVDRSVRVGGLPAVTFEVAIDDGVDCGEAGVPCTYGFMGPQAESNVVSSDYHRQQVWLVPGVPNGPLMLMASVLDSNDDWLSMAGAVVASMIVGAEEESETIDRFAPDFEPDANILADAFLPIEPGRYRIDTLGTPLAFTAGEGLFVAPNFNGLTVITLVDGQGPGDRDIVMFRPDVLANTDTLSTAVEPVPASQFDDWVVAMTDNPALVRGPEPTTVGGIDAVLLELRPLPDQCVPGNDLCTSFGENPGINFQPLLPGSTTRIY